MVKKGYVRTLEAILGIIILLVFVYGVLPRFTFNEDPSEVQLIKDSILTEVREDQIFRDEILLAADNTFLIDSSNTDLSNFVAEIINLDMYDFIVGMNDAEDFTIPDISNSPKLLPEDKDIFSDSILISEDPANAKIFTIYFWEV